MNRPEPENRDLFAIADLSQEFGISTRAIRFYERNGFIRTHEDVNPVSGRKVYGMKWIP